MAQMLPMIQVIPEMNFALDPATGIYRIIFRFRSCTLIYG